MKCNKENSVEIDEMYDREYKGDYAKHKADIVGLVKTNIDWRHVGVRDRWIKKVKIVWPSAKIVMDGNKISDKGDIKQYGGIIQIFNKK